MRNLFEQKIVNLMGEKIKHTDGYVKNPADNVFDFITPDLYEDDLKQGDGHELDSNFKALYSSSALCVNSFAIVKKYVSDIELFGFKDFYSAQFEKHLFTGLGGFSPNLDFFLENDTTFIGIESKFLEPLEMTTADFSDSYFSDKNRFPEIKILMEKYKNYSGYLDVAQLLKHSMGLKNNCGLKKPVLLYVYWRPENYTDYEVYSALEKELESFSSDLRDVIEFRYFSYEEIWNEISKNEKLQGFVEPVKKRYLLTISNHDDKRLLFSL